MLLSLAPTLPRIRYKVRPAWLVGGDSGTKFALHGLLAVTAVQSSPCSGKTRQIVPFWVSRASFVPEVGPCDSCRASFVSPWHPPRSQLSALRRPWAPRPATEPRSPPWLCGLAASFTSEVGVLHYTKPSGACHRRVGASCSAIPPSGGRGGVRTCRGPGGWTLRLAVLTRRCAAKPYWWHGGQPAQATTSRVNVRIKGRSCPPAEPVSLLGANPRRACPQQSAENCAQKPARPRRRTMIGSKYRPFRAPRIRIVAERPRPR